ncbi:LADA_0G16380g1_1 [Lachancea dasiensis]|uniref:LADA_0G16380g1_1 n=1 Tax=Lachancea dasiensis TaxID=1072105 RepID=A0A1G4JX75_9SACH|nr:LADA_0G16380g1_1 [Lachancea dasiensis]
MVSFEISILGACGGPLDGCNQGFLLSEAGTHEEKHYMCVDAGSGLRQIADMMDKSCTNTRQANLDCREDMVQSLYERTQEPLHKFVDARCQVIRGLGSIPKTDSNETTMTRALRLLNNIGDYFITHPHLDHVAALAINSPAFSGPEKTVWGLPATTEAIQKHIFNDIVWPNLFAQNKIKIRMSVLEEARSYHIKSIPNWSVTAFQVSHGVMIESRLPCISTLYLIQNTLTKDSVLMCGDLESDVVSHQPLLAGVWRHLSLTIPLKHLKGIYIECSSSNGIEDTQLYGHLSPKYLVYELKQLSRAYGSALDGLQVSIIHVKMALGEVDPRLQVLDQVRTIAAAEGLGGIIFTMALQGYTFVL